MKLLGIEVKLYKSSLVNVGDRGYAKKNFYVWAIFSEESDCFIVSGNCMSYADEPCLVVTVDEAVGIANDVIKHLGQYSGAITCTVMYVLDAGESIVASSIKVPDGLVVDGVGRLEIFTEKNRSEKIVKESKT